MSTPAAAPAQAPSTGTRAMELHFEVHVLYANEARYLDGDRFGDWLDLFTEDLVYWAPTRTNRLRRQQRLSVSAPGGAAFFDETKDSLAWRVRRFESGMAWAEDPPSRTRHLITNLLVRPAEEDEAVEQGVSEETAREHAHYVAETGFLVYRNRLEHEVDLYSGGRTDLLRREADGSLRVARRTILLEQNVLLAKNISTFF